jgi:hypothetical protein
MPADDDIGAVFESWRARQPTPDRVKLTPDRAALIRARLRTYDADDLVQLVVYAYEADAPECRFWRGENDRNQRYLGLDNLLVASKLADRVDRARAWADGESGDIDEPEDPLVLSPIGRLRSESIQAFRVRGVS